jgi:hypothetical protein
MTRYLLSAHTVDGAGRQPMTADEMKKSMVEIGALEREMKSAGVWLFSARLHDPETATVVRMSDGQVLTTDGPFTEAKEHLGGFYIIEVPDLDAALRWATKVTAATRTPIEVRPFAAFTDKPNDW